MSDDAGIGHNNPPPDPFLASLEERNAALLDQVADLEMARRKVPRAVEKDEDMAAVTAFVLKAREIARAAEKARVEFKEPYLDRGRKIDSFFGSIRSFLEETAVSMEQRNTAFLAARRAAAKAQAEAAAAKARQDAAEAQKRAQEALAQEEAAKAARQATEAALRDAAGHGEAFGDNVVPLVRDGAAESALRHATQSADEATAAAAGALETAAEAQAAANAAADVAEGSRLGRVVAGAGAVRLKGEYTFRVGDEAVLLRSLGPLGPFVPRVDLAKALARAAKAKPQPPEIPGVTFTFKETVTTTALRKKETP